jgi:DNA-binding transcriptional ArsR family regulator
MLITSVTTRILAADVQAYLHETLGTDTPIRLWSGAKSLPYFLQDAFDIHEFQLGDKDILLVSARKERLPALRTLRTQLDKLAYIADRLVVFATGSLASYERRRLVEQKIPFVVPGNQLYLPGLGIDFREYFRRPQGDVTGFTPATQALFIGALLRKEWHGIWQPGDLTSALGYTAMTLTRAIRELAGAGLLTARQQGKGRVLLVNHAPAQAWELAAPYLRTPVRRTEWVDGQLVRHFKAPVAGLSALAVYSMLTEPTQPVHAASATQWKGAREAGARHELVPAPRAVQWQIWNYPPRLLHDSKVVDPLSLTLSLKAEMDDRVLQALDELRGRFPW